MVTKTDIIVVDDDPDISRLIRESLEDEGYSVTESHLGGEALALIQELNPSLIILDIMLPEMDGLEICRRVRDTTLAPIILISAKSRDFDKILGLEVGADDYLAKPFGIDELVARVRAHLRRNQRLISGQQHGYGAASFQFGHVEVYPETYEVHREGQIVNLSTKEFQIVQYLVEHKNQVVTREQIYDAVWGGQNYGDINTVTVHIKNIRNKLDEDGNLIKTVWGIGYRLVGGDNATKYSS